MNTDLPCSSSFVDMRPGRALFRIQSTRESIISTASGDVRSPTITQLLGSLQLHVTRVDRRPCLGARSLDDYLYFIEVEEEEEGDTDHHHVSKRNGSGALYVPWDVRLKTVEVNAVNAGGDILLLGRW
jgi:hypothetical protein